MVLFESGCQPFEQLLIEVYLWSHLLQLIVISSCKLVRISRTSCELDRGRERTALFLLTAVLHAEHRTQALRLFFRSTGQAAFACLHAPFFLQ